ncbi:MAG: nuclear transport factor 2 family protein, partial [Dehalococcoidia bacterium]
MCDNEELELRLGVMEDIEAIKKLKAKYWRCVDNKLWDELRDCFTGDATLEYGTDNPKGRDAIIDFLSKSTGNKKIVTIHQGHNPEIEITG